MGGSSRMLMAGLGSIWCIVCCALYIIIVGPLFNKLVPFLREYTPTYWWNALGGGMIDWIIPFVYILICLCGLLAIIRMCAEATVVVDYESGY